MRLKQLWVFSYGTEWASFWLIYKEKEKEIWAVVSITSISYQIELDTIDSTVICIDIVGWKLIC